MGRLKFFERKMEDRTVVVCMHLDDLRIGVKSQSNPAMAGSYRNMPQYSLVALGGDVKYRRSLQVRKDTELSLTLKLSSVCNRSGGQRVRCCSKTGTTESEVKVPKCMLSVTN